MIFKFRSARLIMRRFALLLCLLVAHLHAYADTPATGVVTVPTPQNTPLPHVQPGGEGWYDVGGYCRVVDVATNWQFGSRGQEVLIPGPAAQWEQWRQEAALNTISGLTVVSCCPPATNITTLCNEAGATPVEVSRQYGKNGETDVVSATCTDQWGRTYTDSAPVSCTGSNAADGSAKWVVGSSDTTSNCTPNAATSACSASCPTTVGTTTTWDSCGNVTAVNSCSISCCMPSYSYSCSGAAYVRTDNTCGTGSATVGTCTLQSATTSYTCPDLNYDDSYPSGNCTYSYLQCNGGAWGCPAYCDSCFGEIDAPNSPVSISCTDGSHPVGYTDPVYGGYCNYSYWAPP